MAEIFSGLGGLMKGLSGFMPQDDPNVKVMNAQTDVNESKKRLTELYAQIGRQAAEQYGLASFGELADQINLAQGNLAAAENALQAALKAKEAQERAELEKEAQTTCSACGAHNPEGVKFCQECGAKLGESAKLYCGKCGMELKPGTRFCGACGARQPEV